MDNSDQLVMSTDGSTASLDPEKTYVANVQLSDGRELKVPVTVEVPRPQISLLNKGIQDGSDAAPSPVRLTGSNDFPVGQRLVFFLKSRLPKDFPRDEKVEVGAVNGSFHTTLSLQDGLMLEDADTAIVTVDPLSRFGGSAFGPIQVRVVTSDGVGSDWLPLGTLVREPGFKDLRCPRAVSKPCMLTGNNLFLASTIGTTEDMNDSTDVPPDFTGTQLSVPHPVNGVLYLRLRDDDDAVQTLALPVTLDNRLSPPTSASTTPAQAPPAPATQPPPPTPPAAAPAPTPNNAPSGDSAKPAVSPNP